MKTKHPLMHNNFLSSDMNAVRKLIKNKNLLLTQSKKVLEFEKKWSKWLGVKYSVFVNSGSSANFISMLILKSFSPKKKRNYCSDANMGVRYKFCNYEWF